MSASKQAIVTNWIDVKIAAGLVVRITVTNPEVVLPTNTLVEVIFTDGAKVTLEKDWGVLTNSEAPINFLADDFMVTFDQFSLDEIECAGWLLLIGYGYGPLSWNDKRPKLMSHLTVSDGDVGDSNVSAIVRASQSAALTDLTPETAIRA